MNLLQVKAFTHCDEAKLEAAMNKWLENEKDAEVFDIKFSVSSTTVKDEYEVAYDTYAALIIYRNKRAANASQT